MSGAFYGVGAVPGSRREALCSRTAVDDLSRMTGRRAPARRNRRRLALAGLAAQALLLAAGAPAALAQLGNPIAPVAPVETTTTTTVVTANSSSSSSSGIGASASVAILIVGTALVLIAAIAWFILRDARSHAPTREGALAAPSPRRSLEQRQRDRAKAKAARQQRKRNR